MKYNYYEAVKADVLAAIDSHYDMSKYPSREAFENALLTDSYFINSVTGIEFETYSFDRDFAAKCVLDNMDLLYVTFEFIGSGLDGVKEAGPELCDVFIRYYFLEGVLSDTLDEIWDV